MTNPALMAAVAVTVLSACTPESPGPSIAPAELAERIRGGSAPLVLDVRSADEYAAGHIPGAVNIPHDELPSRLGELLAIAPADEVVVHCRSGRRAKIAEETLRANGFTQVYDLEGHWEAWQQAGLPTE